MANIMIQSPGTLSRHSTRSRESGFSMIEVLVAMAIFLVISGSAISLFRQHAPVYSRQQNQAAINTTLRNALAQMQIDVVNAGSNNFQAAPPNVPVHMPIGITFTNSAGGGGCHADGTTTYGPGCFDAMNVIVGSSTTPPSHPNGPVDMTGTALALTPPPGTTATQLAADFHSGDQVLVFQNDGSQLSTAVLTSDAAVVGSDVQLLHMPSAGCTPTTGSCDPLGIEMLGNGKFGTAFTAADWVVNISQSSVSYSVDTTDPNNPKLMRTQAGGAPSVVAEQVIGFKVGAATWNNAAALSSGFYDFNPNAGGNFDFTAIQAVRFSLIVRSSPGATDANDTYRNAFDGQPYRIQAMSVVVNPRNLSMQDNPN